jgi:hypothetical protein
MAMLNNQMVGIMLFKTADFSTIETNYGKAD